jgi:hypothetical protein
VEEHQRQYLLADYEELIADIRREAASEETPSAGNRYWIDNCDRIISWLEGGPKPTVEVREFLEDRLEGFDDATNFKSLAYEHDVLVAAIEELR